MKPSLVLTYFKPFGGRDYNNSELLTRNLDCKKYALDVSWNLIEEELDEILKEEPEYLILTGEAISYEELTFELRAKNIANGTDVFGVSKSNEEIVAGGKKELYSKIITPKGFHLGNDAGSYLCNCSYYLALNKTKNTNTKVIFIHVPVIKDREKELFGILTDFLEKMY